MRENPENQNLNLDELYELYNDLQYPPREYLQGKLLDYLMHLAIKNISGHDASALAKFDPQLSASFFEYIANHPEKADFPSDEVYFYIIACYENEVEDVLGVDFYETENEQFDFNNRLARIFEKERRQYYAAHPELLAKEKEVINKRSRRLSSSLEEKMREKTKLKSLEIDDLL